MNQLNHFDEVKKGERFQFGRNWMNFLKNLDEERIEEAGKSMFALLHESQFQSKTFLDLGSGSGLSSLVARKTGAIVFSMDYDPKSVASTKLLKDKYFPNDDNWKVDEASVLDKSYLDSLGQFDIVYSWGVLHHTGNMWAAFENVVPLVRDKGYLFIALYNDQAYKSRIWWHVKKLYCSSWFGKLVVKSVFYPIFFFTELLISVKNKRNNFKAYKKQRGMSMVHDWKDWLGGFPFEVAKVEDVFNFLKSKNFGLYSIKTTTSQGCNQFVFQKQSRNPS